jgi:hypothetical protein
MGRKMITSSFDSPTTEPRLTFNFTTASLNSRITFARTTGASNPATFVNSSGNVTLATNNQPRFDYDPVTLACKGLLIEQSRANAYIYSQDFNDASWTKSAATIGNNVAISPDGTQNADKLIETATTATHYMYRTMTPVSATAYTFSVYAKAAGRTIFRLNAGGGFATTGTFDLSAVTATLNAGTSATITPAGNGWYRCIVSGVSSSATAGQCQTILNTGTYAGDGTSGIFFWGAQMEVGASATSYIPTTATTLTRNADVATITGTSFSEWWKIGKGSALVRARPSTVSGTRPWVQFDDATANNIIALRGNTTNPELYIRASGSDQAQIDAGTIADNTRYRLAGAWANNNCAASINSGVAVRDGVATIPVVTQARLGSDGTNYLNGYLEAIEYYDTRMLNASLQVVSSTAGYQSIINPVFADTIIS